MNMSLIFNRILVDLREKIYLIMVSYMYVAFLSVRFLNALSYKSLLEK